MFSFRSVVNLELIRKDGEHKFGYELIYMLRLGSLLCLFKGLGTLVL